MILEKISGKPATAVLNACAKILQKISKITIHTTDEERVTDAVRITEGDRRAIKGDHVDMKKILQ